MSLEPHIRAETPADFAAVRRINEAAFEQPDEAAIVDALRRSGARTVSLVAGQHGQIVGHIMFSPVTIRSDSGNWQAIALAPMAVEPRWQRQGIGSALVRAGLARCRAIGEAIVFVLGHSAYYPRFGFRPAPPLGLSCEYPVPDEVFMVLELESGAIAGRTGLVTYAPEFANV